MHPAKASSPIEKMFAPIVIFEIDEQPLNAREPIIVSVLGMVMLLRLEHWKNVKLCTDSIPSGRLTLFKLSHIANAPSPMPLTPPSGIVTLLKREHLANDW